MRLLKRLDEWNARGRITVEQHAALASIVRRQRVSLYIEINSLMYLGVAGMVAGLGWLVTRNFERIGDGAIIAGLVLTAGASLFFCFRRATPYSNDETESPSLSFDYVLYFSAAVIGVLAGFLQLRMPPPLGPPPDILYLASAAIAFGLAYRFDNRLVLSLGLASLASAFGLRLSQWGFDTPRPMIMSAVAFSIFIAAAGWAVSREGIKRHFLDTYFHLAALTGLGALVSDNDYVLLLLIASAAIAWAGFRRRSAWFVCYALVAAYIGISIAVLSSINDLTLGMFYVLVTGIGVVVALVVIARTVGREP